MALKTSFLNDREYSADDVNKIISRIVGQGVSPEYEGIEDAKTYNLDRLNDLTKSYVERGVAYQGDPALKVVRLDDGYYISPGTAFFGNGTVTEVTENEKIEIISGVQCYIYMVSDVENNANYIEVSETIPEYETNTNIVPLASVDADGNITDMRFYARGKLPGFQNEDYGLKCIELHLNSNEGSTELVVDLHTTHVSMLMAKGMGMLNALILNGNGGGSSIYLKAGGCDGDHGNIGPFHLYYKPVGGAPSYDGCVVLTKFEYIGGTEWKIGYKYVSNWTIIATTTLYYV